MSCQGASYALWVALLVTRATFGYVTSTLYQVWITQQFASSVRIHQAYGTVKTHSPTLGGPGVLDRRLLQAAALGQWLGMAGFVGRCWLSQLR